jgi:hypothetical protein
LSPEDKIVAGVVKIEIDLHVFFNLYEKAEFSSTPCVIGA